MTDETKRVFREFDDLLNRERRALLNGELTLVPELTERKEELVSRIAALGDAGLRGAEELREKADRNQKILAGAMEGLRAVADRLAELHGVRSGWETYDRSGRRNRIGMQRAGSVEKRA